jgi:hypothetical protein
MMKATRKSMRDTRRMSRHGAVSARPGSRARAYANGARDESGAVLVLALVFLIVVGGVVASLATWATNDLRNTTNFKSARQLQYAANDATQVAIQAIRYTPLLGTNQTLNASPPSYCWGNVSDPPQLPSIDGQTMAVWCSTVWNPSSANTRVVTFSTCPSSVSNAACAANPDLQAVVTFDDYPSGGAATSPTTAECVVYCGTGMTVDSWNSSPTVPTVATSAGLSPTTGHITGGTSVTIKGTGFVNGATTVNFVEESGGTPVGDNYVASVPASQVTVNSTSTQITAPTPGVTEGTTYYVTVTTPGGTSPYNSSAVFTYSAVAPSVTSINTGGNSTPGGSITGGTAVQITGTGFFSGATVNFIEESGGVAVTPAVSIPASYVTVNSATSMTAVAPAITIGSTYWLKVTTAGGSSTAVYTYVQYYPVVSGFGSGSATSGPTSGGTAVTITGTGFFTGTTVSLVEDLAGVAVTTINSSATNVVVVSPTTITFKTGAAPFGTLPGATFFITVTTPAGTSSGGPVFTY